MIETGSKYNASQLAYLKGEALCAELCDNGVMHEDILTKRLSGFKQRFRNDIEKVSQGTDDFDIKKLFEISLNRDGLYDVLPEGLFHQTKGNSRTPRVQDMIDEHKQFKEEEKAARTFFMPLEHEFFMYGVRMEQQERLIQQGFIKGTFPEAMYLFWDVSHSLPINAQEVFLRILPWAKYITGNINYTTQVLELLVKKPVIVSEVRMETIGTKAAGFQLGKDSLGETTVSGQSYDDDVLQWIFKITNLSSNECAAFIPGGSMRQVLERFDDFFIPVYVDAIFQYETIHKLETEECIQFLGYNLVL